MTNVKPLTTGKNDKDLKKEDLRNLIHNAERELNISIAFDGSELAVTYENVMSKLKDHSNVIVKREELIFRVSIIYTTDNYVKYANFH